MTDSTFTFGMTPESVVREAFARECPDGTFAVCAQGIANVTLSVAVLCDGCWTVDELLGALNNLRALYDERADAVLQGGPRGGYSADEIISNAASLRTGILSVLGIEEI